MQGKCRYCRTVWEWSGRPRLRDARCPHCGMELEKTTRLKQFTRRRATKLMRFTDGRYVLTRTKQQGYEIDADVREARLGVRPCGARRTA